MDRPSPTREGSRPCWRLSWLLGLSTRIISESEFLSFLRELTLPKLAIDVGASYMAAACMLYARQLEFWYTTIIAMILS